MYTLLHDEKYVAAVLDHMRAAKKEIWISTFKAQDTERKRGARLHELIGAVCQKAHAGCKVLFLMNWDERMRGVAKTNKVVANIFRSAGVDVRYLPNSRCCHAKILLVDRQDLFIGSHNWSQKSLFNNFETSIHTTDRELIKQVEAVYLGVFAKAKAWL